VSLPPKTRFVSAFLCLYPVYLPSPAQAQWHEGRGSLCALAPECTPWWAPLPPGRYSPSVMYNLTDIGVRGGELFSMPIQRRAGVNRSCALRTLPRPPRPRPGSGGGGRLPEDSLRRLVRERPGGACALFPWDRHTEQISLYRLGFRRAQVRSSRKSRCTSTHRCNGRFWASFSFKALLLYPPPLPQFLQNLGSAFFTKLVGNGG